MLKSLHIILSENTARKRVNSIGVTATKLSGQPFFNSDSLIMLWKHDTCFIAMELDEYLQITNCMDSICIDRNGYFVHTIMMFDVDVHHT